MRKEHGKLFSRRSISLIYKLRRKLILIYSVFLYFLKLSCLYHVYGKFPLISLALYFSNSVFSLGLISNKIVQTEFRLPTDVTGERGVKRKEGDKIIYNLLTVSSLSTYPVPSFCLFNSSYLVLILLLQWNWQMHLTIVKFWSPNRKKILSVRVIV